MVIIEENIEEALQLAVDQCYGWGGCAEDVIEEMCPYCQLTAVVESQKEIINRLDRLVTAASLINSNGAGREVYEMHLEEWADDNQARMEAADEDADEDSYRPRACGKGRRKV